MQQESRIILEVKNSVSQIKAGDRRQSWGVGSFSKNQWYIYKIQEMRKHWNTMKSLILKTMNTAEYWGEGIETDLNKNKEESFSHLQKQIPIKIKKTFVPVSKTRREITHIVLQWSL